MAFWNLFGFDMARQGSTCSYIFQSFSYSFRVWNSEVIQVFYKLKMRAAQVRTHCLPSDNIRQVTSREFQFQSVSSFLLKEQDGSASFAGMPTPLLDPTKKEFEPSAWKRSTKSVHDGPCHILPSILQILHILLILSYSFCFPHPPLILRFHDAKKELLSAERNILRELGFEAQGNSQRS